MVLGAEREDWIHGVGKAVKKELPHFRRIPFRSSLRGKRKKTGNGK